MRLSTSLAIISLAVVLAPIQVPAQTGLPLGHPDFLPSPEHPLMWLGDGSICYPGAKPVTEWDVDTGQNIVWKAPMPSWANATTIVVGDRVIIVSEPCTVLCYDADTGKRLWHDASSILDDELSAEEAARTKREWSIFNRMWSTFGRESPDIDWDRNYDEYARFLVDRGLAVRKETDPAKVGRKSPLFDFTVSRDTHPWSRWGVFPLNELGEFPCMPVSDGERLWITAGFDQITCYAIDTGAILWRVHEEPLPCQITFGSVSTLFVPAPQLVDGDLLTYRRRHYRLYDGAIGELKWQLPGHTDDSAGHTQYGTPVVLHLPLPDGSGEMAVLVDTMDWVIRLADGKLLRRDCGTLSAADRARARRSRPDTITADVGGHSMVADDERDIVIFADYQTGGKGIATNKTYAVRLRCGASPDQVQAELLWDLDGREEEGVADTDGTGLIHDGVYYPNNGSFAAIAVERGEIQGHARGGRGGYPSTILAGPYLFVGNNGGDCVFIDRQSLQPVSKVQSLGWSNWKSKDFADRRDALRTEMGERTLQAIADGVLAWLPGINDHKATYTGTGVVYGNPPTFHGERLYIRTYTDLLCIGPT